MSNWWKPIRDRARGLLAGLPGSAMRTAERELEEVRAELLSVQAELASNAGRLKGLKAQRDADPKELGRLEGNVAALTRQASAARQWIAQLEQQLDALDPDRSIRAFLR